MSNQVRIHFEAKALDDSNLQAYNESLKNLSPEMAQRLTGLESQDGFLTYSTPFRLVHLLNSGFLPEGTRLAERPDMETAIAHGPEFVKNYWIESGIGLKEAGQPYNPNDVPADVLTEELKRAGIEIGHGKLIPLNVLKNELHQNSHYGLVLKLSDRFEKGFIRELGDFRWDYMLNTRMARANLNRGRYWLCNDSYLDNSYSDSRVVVASGEAAQKI